HAGPGCAESGLAMVWSERVLECAYDDDLDGVVGVPDVTGNVTAPRRGIDVTGHRSVHNHLGDTAAPIRPPNYEIADRRIGQNEMLFVTHSGAVERVTKRVPRAKSHFFFWSDHETLPGRFQAEVTQQINRLEFVKDAER